MPRPLIQQKPADTKVAGEAIRREPTTRLDASALRQRLRQKRSSRYLQAVKLDAGTHHASAEELQRLQDALSDEFGDITPPQRLLGLVAKCYLGENFEVHTLDCSGTAIVRHYRSGEPLPPLLEPARSLALYPRGAMTPRYDFIEVYEDHLCAVTENGDATLLDSKGGR